jgi:putative ABC transport system permease protein
LALMAMTLALVANSGLNTMISSFRQATESWLEQRLAAQLYFRSDVDALALDSWLAREAPQADLVERYRIRLDRRTPAESTVAVEVVTLQDHPRFRGTVTLLRSASQAWPRFFRGEGALISERAWRVEGWQVGDPLTMCTGREVPVLGVYHDYGNPLPQWMISEGLFGSCWRGTAPASRALVGPPEVNWAALRQQLIAAFGLRDGEVVSQAELRGVGLGVFDRTFRVTNALNALTLLVAGIGIFCAVSAIHHHRVVQQALLAALGLSRRERGALLLLQWGLFGLLSMVLVWPFGTVLAGYLAGVVTPVAFGWSFPLALEWRHYGGLALVAAACLVLAVLLPSLRLIRTAPGVMLREEAV